MNIQTLSLGVLGTNCYIISKDKQALIIDPSGDAHIIIETIKQAELVPQAILLTHAHFDHIGAVHEVRKAFNIEVYLHEAEKDWLEDANLNRSEIHFGKMGAIISDSPEHYLPNGDYTIGNFNFKVIHTPGHSPGSVTFIFNDEKFIVSGDVLFHHGIGRTDLPEGDMSKLQNSIVKELYTLPDDFTVYPGHGISTTIHLEKLSNPYTLQFYEI